MMKNMVLSLLFLLAGLHSTDLNAQRFSLLAEVGGLRSQVDGDKVNGFHYRGYTFGIGSHYTFSPEHFLAVKTSYYDQGSRRKKEIRSFKNLGHEVEVDFNTIGLEIGYKYNPLDKFYYLGAGFVRHQIVDFSYKVFESPLVSFDSELEPDQVRSGFNSLKLYCGLDLFKRASVYASLESSVSNMLRSDFGDIKAFIPYSFSIIFSYELFAAKEVKTRRKAGTKMRN